MRPVLLSACRTPVGKFLGSLSALPAPDLGALVIREAVRRAGVSPARIDEVIMGNVLSAGLGQAPARQAALRAGLPPEVAALTINKMCGSGLKAVMLAAQAVKAGDAQAIVAGGMESMSLAPHLLAGARVGWKFGHRAVVDSIQQDGLHCAMEDRAMGGLAEGTAQTREISRADQDEFARTSHHRAFEAAQAGAFAGEIVPVIAPTRRGPEEITCDEGIRAGVTSDDLARLKPSFAAEGTVTPGNASQLSDGAAALLVASPAFARSHQSQPLAEIVGYATAGLPPKDVFLAPIPAIRAVLAKTGLSLRDIDLFELNEAFAAQALACVRELHLPLDKVNVRGGAIALGHPLGASGARVLVTLLHAMKSRGARRGLAALCLGGGNAVGLVVEIPDSADSAGFPP